MSLDLVESGGIRLQREDGDVLGGERRISRVATTRGFGERLVLIIIRRNA